MRLMSLAEFRAAIENNTEAWEQFADWQLHTYVRELYTELDRANAARDELAEGIAIVAEQVSRMAATEVSSSRDFGRGVAHAAAQVGERLSALLAQARAPERKASNQ